jgi:hypothetical protein
MPGDPTGFGQLRRHSLNFLVGHTQPSSERARAEFLYPQYIVCQL